ncbi:hypothetical protein ACSX1A_06300 [Pontibacter sp. MBLB2868]|uniref:hypothetical protein n=1 Tax=Pontibacter sp. MBLB2868 TaxID=3451555 RepID=UPI003F74C0B1
MKDNVKVAVNGYGVIGKRAADAVQLQDDIELAGVCDVVSDGGINMATHKDYPVHPFDGCGTLLSRTTDPWESHLNGIMNTLVPEPEIPSNQGPYAQSVDPELDVITAAVKVPETIAAIRALTWLEENAQASIQKTNAALGVRKGSFLQITP